MANRVVISNDRSNFIAAWTVDNTPYVILKWTIEHFSSAESLLKSPCFDISPFSKWNLILDPNVTVDEDIFVVIYLRRDPRCLQPNARFLLYGELSVHGPNAELIKDTTFEEIYDPANNNLEFKIPKVLFTANSPDTLLVRCEMIVSREKDLTNEPRSRLEKLSNDMKNLLQEYKFTDVEIRVADDVIKVHSPILHARSPALSDIIKVSKNYVSEDDTKCPYFVAILLFMYTGNPDLMLSSIPIDMFGSVAVIARKWELHDLVNILTPVKIHAKTCLKYERTLYAWQIKSLSRTELGNEGISSPEFTTTNSKWKLILAKSPDNSFGLYLKKISPDTAAHKIEVEFRVNDNRNNLTVTKRRQYVLSPRENQVCGFSSICGANEMRVASIEDDVLNVHCTLKVRLDSESFIEYTSTFVDVSEEDSYSIKYLRTLSRNLKDLYQSGRYTDLKLCSTSGIHRVHKAILWARSPYLATLLQPRAAEYVSLSVDDAALKDILSYIYSSELPYLTLTNVSKIYTASHLLGLQELLVACRSYFLRHITVDNVLEILVLAHKYGENELAKAAEDFVCTRGNAKMILPTTRWRLFRDEHSTLAIKIYHNLAWSYCNHVCGR